jgi:intein/homing endonuclease
MKPSFQHTRRPLVGWMVGLLLGCAAERDAPFSGHDATPLTLVAQRVTATVKKEAATLVRIETDGGVVVTTPEHPFATPEAGWIPAGQLAPGDRVVSARFGTARVVSARKEKPAQPVPVFNLTVARSHAYLVGADQVLVHNTGCNAAIELAKKRSQELSQKESELEALQGNGQQTPENRQKIADIQKEIKKIRTSITEARRRIKAAGIDPDTIPGVARLDASARYTQRIQELDQKIAKLEKELSSSSDKAETQRRLEQVYKERQTVAKRLRDAQAKKRKRVGEGASDDVSGAPVAKLVHAPSLSKEGRLLWSAEQEYESAKQAVEATRQELEELERRPLRTEDERKAAAARKAELEKLLKKQEKIFESTKRIVDLQKQVATLNTSILTGGKRPDLLAQRKALKAQISTERSALKQRKESITADYKEKRRAWRRRLQTTVQRMQEELAALREQPSSSSDSERITRLERAIKTGTKFIEARKKADNIRKVLRKAREKHENQLRNGEDTSAVVQTIAKLEPELARRKAARTRLHAEVLLLGLVQAKRRNQLDDDDAPFIAEIQGMLANPTTLDDGRLAEIARNTEDTLRGDSDTLDAAFFEEIWGAGDNDEAPDAERQEPGRDDFVPPDDSEPLDPELQAMLIALQQGDLAAPEPGSPVARTEPPGDSGQAPSNDPMQQDAQLRLEWQRTQQLQDLRDSLEISQMLGEHRDLAYEARLIQQIAELEQQLQNPPFDGAWP